MLLVEDPQVAPEVRDATLVFQESFMTATTIRPLGTDPEADVIYSVSTTDQGKVTTLSRIAKGGGRHPVAVVRFPNSLDNLRGKPGTIEFMARPKSVLPFDQWLPNVKNITQKGDKFVQPLVIDGERYHWTEVSAGEPEGRLAFCLMNGPTKFATYVPTRTDRAPGALDRIMTRAHIKFTAGELPSDSILDEVISSLLVTQQLIQLDRGLIHVLGGFFSSR